MASAFLRPLFRPHALGLGLSLSIATVRLAQQKPIRLDAGTIPILSSEPYRKNAEVPVIEKGHLNPRAVRQISSGSIIGM